MPEVTLIRPPFPAREHDRRLIQRAEASYAECILHSGALALLRIRKFEGRYQGFPDPLHAAFGVVL